MYSQSQIEVRMIDAIRKGKFKIVARPLSWIFEWIVRSRNWLYDQKVLIQKHAPLPVVSIGNLVIGGTGKTQVALLLAETLQDVAILTRGFRAKAEKKRKPLVVSSNHDPKECGDEPLLLASRLPNAKIIVNRNRYKSAIEAEKRGARIVFLDDGMQHRQLFRDFEIVVLNDLDPFGGKHFFPSGLLRDELKRLASADLIVFVGNPAPWLEKNVANLTAAPQVVTQIDVKKIHTLNEKTSLPSLKGLKVAPFCAIGNPERFITTLKAQGAIIVAVHFLGDHKKITLKELQKFALISKKRGAEYLFCTEKDKVKLAKSSVQNLALPIGWVEAELKIVKNREAWDQMTKKITYLAGLKS